MHFDTQGLKSFLKTRLVNWNISCRCASHSSKLSTRKEKNSDNLKYCTDKLKNWEDTLGIYFRSILCDIFFECLSLILSACSMAFLSTSSIGNISIYFQFSIFDNINDMFRSDTKQNRNELTVTDKKQCFVHICI